MKPRSRFWIVVVTLVVLAGCERAFQQPAVDLSPPARAQRYTSLELNDVIKFAGDFAVHSETDRLAECRKILQLYQAKQELGARIYLVLAQVITPACGDSRETLALLEASRAQIKDKALAQYLAYQEVVLQRLYAEKNQAAGLKRKLLQTNYKQQKLNRLLKSHQAELRALQDVQVEMADKQAEIENKQAQVKALQEKLDALKMIEQNLAEPKGN